MAGLKRKEYPMVNSSVKGSSKKSKTGTNKIQRPPTPPSDLEAQTDSDPIIESDTTEHSGDDDGASWPSDQEEEAEIITTNDLNGQHSRAKVPRPQSKHAGITTEPNTGTDGTKTCG